MFVSPNPFVPRALEVFKAEFGEPARATKKVMAWTIRPAMGAVVQIDQPTTAGAYVWLPYPPAGAPIPAFAQVRVYAAGEGRHSNTKAAPGLEDGKPALRFLIKSEAELRGAVSYIRQQGHLGAS